jgi:hypothetical protein
MSHKRLRTPVYTDTLFYDVISVWGNTCAQLFVSENGHAKIYPMSSKGQAFDKLGSYCSTIGIPKFMVSDNAGEETGGEWDRVRKKYLSPQRTTEPHSPWQNRAEREIQELKRHFRHIMHRSRCPERFWNYGMEYTAQIRDRMSRPMGENRTESMTGGTPNISEYINFDFYGWVKYHDVKGGGTENDLGR